MGDTETGSTWFWVDEGIDTGPIAIQGSVPIPSDTKPSTLYYETLVPLGAKLFEDLLVKLEKGERPSEVQDESKATYEPLRPKKPAT
jgi:methionyl-tRNA formyltransferase